MIFYDLEDFLKPPNCYDILFDVIGCTKQKSCRQLLKPGGKIVSVDGLSCETESTAQSAFIKTPFEKGKMKAIINRIYSIDTSQRANTYVDTGRKKRNRVIKMNEASEKYITE